MPNTARYWNVCGGSHEKYAEPPTNVTGVANGVQVEPFKYSKRAVAEPGSGSTVTVAPAVPPAGIDALSAVPTTVGGVTVGGVTVIVNTSE